MGGSDCGERRKGGLRALSLPHDPSTANTPRELANRNDCA